MVLLKPGEQAQQGGTIIVQQQPQGMPPQMLVGTAFAAAPAPPPPPPQQHVMVYGASPPGMGGIVQPTQHAPPPGYGQTTNPMATSTGSIPQMAHSTNSMGSAQFGSFGQATSGTSYYTSGTTANTTSPFGSGSGVYQQPAPMGIQVFQGAMGMGLYGVSTEGPPGGGLLAKAKKKKKKKAKTPTMTKEEQEDERMKQQAELEAAEKPNLGGVVDENQHYLKDKGPKQIIINYLPLEMEEEELKQIFEQYGPVECARFVTDKNSGKSKGYGFVYYYYSAHASAAINNMNEFELYGKILRVSYAVPQRPRPASGDLMESPANAGGGSGTPNAGESQLKPVEEDDDSDSSALDDE